ncbi:Sporulation related domain protein [compost metagenome]
MDILQYLIELLKTRKQIGIEGLGTLYKKKTPGRYDAETHSFLPPSYTLEFTSDVLEHTNLVEYIHTKRGISEDSAKYFINQFVEQLQIASKNGEYKLDNLGSFSIANEQVTFIPSQDINTGFDFYALPPITAEVKSIPAEENPNVTANISKTIEEPQIEQVQVPEFEHEMSKVEVDENEEILAQPTDEQVSEPVQEISVEEEVELENDQLNHTEEVEDVALGDNQIEIEETKAPKSIESNEATDAEVFEEIKEVNTKNPTEETEPTIEEESDTWNFNDENVVSSDDINTEEISTETNTAVENTIKSDEPSIDFERDEKAEDFKLKSTIHEWDFNNIESKSTVEENTLIGEFDNEYVEEELVVEKTKMPIYQKLAFGLIALIIVFVILYFFKPDIFENFERDTTNPNDKMAMPPIQRSNLKTQQDSISFADSIMKNAEKVGLDVEPAKDTLKVTTTKKEVPTTYTYDVIIASFATSAKAQEYITRMKKKGFDAKVSTMHGKRKNISIATYNNIDSAQKYVNKFRKQFNNVDIYAQPIKNK